MRDDPGLGRIPWCMLGDKDGGENGGAGAEEQHGRTFSVPPFLEAHLDVFEPAAK